MELRGLEPLTFSLRRHRVHVVSREHRVIDVHVAAAKVPWLQPGGTHGAHGLGLSSPGPTATQAMPFGSAVWSRCRGWQRVFHPLMKPRILIMRSRRRGSCLWS